MFLKWKISLRLVFSDYLFAFYTKILHKNHVNYHTKFPTYLLKKCCPKNYLFYPQNLLIFSSWCHPLRWCHPGRPAPSAPASRRHWARGPHHVADPDTRSAIGGQFNVSQYLMFYFFVGVWAKVCSQTGYGPWSDFPPWIRLWPPDNWGDRPVQPLSSLT